MPIERDYFYGNNTAKTRVLKEVFKFASITPPGKRLKLLDVACGNCALWPEFLKEFQHVEFFGVDINKKSIDIA